MTNKATTSKASKQTTTPSNGVAYIAKSITYTLRKNNNDFVASDANATYDPMFGRR